jgi:hypothetical protein
MAATLVLYVNKMIFSAAEMKFMTRMANCAFADYKKELRHSEGIKYTTSHGSYRELPMYV